MKKAINAWSFPKEYTFEECIEAAKRFGFDGIEFNVDEENVGHSLTLSTTVDELLRIKSLCDLAGLKVVSISSSLHRFGWGSSIPEEVSYAHSVLEKQLVAAHTFGADTVLVVPGGMKDGVLLSESRRNSIQNLKAALPMIEKYGVTVGVENIVNRFFTSPYDMLSFVDEVGSPLVQTYLDLGNMMAFSAPEYWCDVLCGRIAKIHIKDVKRIDQYRGRQAVPLLEGDLDFPLVMSILKRDGFDGYLTAEVSNYAALPTDDYLCGIAAAEDKIIEFYNSAT